MANKKSTTPKNSKTTKSETSKPEEEKVVEESPIVEETPTVEEKTEEQPTNEIHQEPVVMTSKSSNDFNVNTKSSNKGILIIGIIAVFIIAALIGMAALVFKTFTGKNKKIEHPLVYITDEKELKFIKSNNKEAKVISESFDGSTSVQYSNKSNRYVLFTKNGNLYLLDTNSSKEAEKIATDVSTFKFSTDDKYIVYTNKDKNLYVYNFKDKVKLDTEISGINDVSNNKVFYKKDDNLYMRDLNGKKEKVKIASDVKAVIFNENYTKVLYSKKNDDSTYDYYLYNIAKEKGDKVLSDINTLYSYNDEFTKFIYGIKDEETTYDLSQIVDDDKKESDESFKEHTYSEYLDGEIDYTTWRESIAEKSKVESRNKIREQLKKDYKLPETYTVYYKEGNKETELQQNVDKVLYSNVDEKRVVYTTTTYDTSDKIKLSEVTYFYKIKDYLEKCKKSTVMYKFYTSDSVEVVDNVEKTVTVYIIKNDFYYLLNNELFYAKINGKKLDKFKSLAEKTKILDSTGDFRNALVYATDVKDSKGDLKYAVSGKITDIVTDAYVSNIEISDSGKMYFYTDYKNKNGDLNIYNGKVTKLLTDISAVKIINDKYMYVLKEYSSKSKTYDLYRYKGNPKLELVDYGVKTVY